MESTKQVPKDPQKVERILTNSLKVFADKRYQRTKVDQIAEMAKVSKGIIFRYYDSKFGLYKSTLQFAVDNIMRYADLSVWKDSHDLTEMIVRATKYKMQLQIKFPDEFKILLDAYSDVNDFNDENRESVHQVVGVNLNQAMELSGPVLDRLDIRDDVDMKVVQGMFNAIMLQIGEETKAYMEQHPDGDLSQMTDIIEHAKGYMGIFERGISSK
ncbi:TetR/AcrR family transcriptional regulator [Lentilactobacillus sp. SPB1-3]|uniref:TetR/AcrR family transcriptional regulator n=1 Tax=Lentilactobacillus terminaliae TaxID=3003483 RepID=A0ACD5DH66_9LACO|nr:TetR/AcrR family transcriptional regulator [Lentilactobacillus sp. SPB1-3]MCZ0977058.1 TetR/AcrR family transcriptional regulator [Lentilactobacillus sp. SPB1-3]